MCQFSNCPHLIASPCSTRSSLFRRCRSGSPWGSSAGPSDTLPWLSTAYSAALRLAGLQYSNKMLDDDDETLVCWNMSSIKMFCSAFSSAAGVETLYQKKFWKTNYLNKNVKSKSFDKYTIINLIFLWSRRPVLVRTPCPKFGQLHVKLKS